MPKEKAEMRLFALFDRQHFKPNERLAALIADVERHYGVAISDEDLGFVSAAGEAVVPKRPTRGTEDLQ